MRLGHVLITGGAGFIGSQLVKRILPEADKVTIIDDLTTGNEHSIPKSKKIHFYNDSILNEELLAVILQDVDYVFHVAARNLVMSMQELKKDLEVNTLGTLVLLEQTKLHAKRLKRFVYSSTSSIYGVATNFPTKEKEKNINTPYAASKYCAEQYVTLYQQNYELPCTIVRLSNVFGPGQLASNPYCGVVAKFFEAIKSNEPLQIHGNGLQTRDFTYIDDAIEAFLTVATNERAIGEIYNVGTGIETTINDLSKIVTSIYRKKDYPVVYVEKRDVDTVERRQLSIKKMKKHLNWRPEFKVDEGLKCTLEWLNEK
ncbi:epimerase [Alkalihalobacillus alcalophilus ATCC 27647 = CGMCC 1.3604]|uniref:Epimerase n=1 Tax=Alkalihalobacillus alcalophilus ATCC 27647 = CGMCC 1.3604 TaxID=1218173 RepID=A0A094WKE2_ALKAL|nr:NAD-dependent epimerase/dehydratase family protein [Alkalihalobacillus alcalophilus]KGA97301.1 epimerase [Alkalihalobacillus alcalophilus ATCC 27647 = CGMCC 1.3604]MED1562522.1 NAD-dependent epimerase/dehydratase family protein [Alkalihalobacillus alcalophilus]THG92139.1 epimerase [Alkalihalobacillus alcalophilus ATCC 27647 = CGMCC 1.3604]